MKSQRRPRHDPATTKALILDAVERLMLEEGYASVTSRRVAAQAGVLPALVQYHFPTTDEMLVATYRRTTEVNFESLQATLLSEDPLRAMWSLQSDPTHTALAMEFMALANHRKMIKAEIADYAKRSRSAKAAALAKLMDKSGIDPAICPPLCASALMVAIGRTLITEEAVGISLGHDEVRQFVEWVLGRMRGKATASKTRVSKPKRQLGAVRRKRT